MSYLNSGIRELSAGEINDLKIQSVEHELLFPNQIKFTLIGISNTETVETILFYRISQTGTWQYIYPETSGTKKIKAVGTIATTGNSYIPSGVTFEYYFQIRNLSGNYFKTKTFQFDYLNPEHKWIKSSRGPLTIYSHGIPKQVINDLLSDANAQFPFISSIAGLKKIKPFRAVIVNNPREASQTFPVISKTSTQDNLYGGFAFQDYGVFLMGGTDLNVLMHESAHLIIGQATDSPTARIPAWLNEGLAMYFEPYQDNRELTARIAGANGILRPLENMYSLPGKTRDVRLFYAQSKSIVKFIMERYGAKKMTQFLHEFKEGNTANNATREVYGISLQRLDKDWRNSIRPEIKRTLIVDPGTFWTSSILGIAFLISATYVGINWLKRKHTQPEEELAEEDAGNIHSNQS